MSEKLEPLELYRYSVSYQKGTEIPICTINEKLKALIELHASWFIEHYEETYEPHWKENEKTNAFMGLIGQKAFEIILQKEAIPYIPNDPLTSRVYYKNYDFNIPKIGTVEIKTIPSYGWNVIIKESEWHGNDFMVAWQMGKEELSMVGWLTKSEVESYPITPKGKVPQTRIASARVIPMKDLHAPKTFVDKLKA
jgi:hypothetical protein